MRLTFDQICGLTAGAVTIEEDSAGIHFQRYTPEQLAAFEKEARCFYKRGMHTCGIRIDFYTDSSSLTVSVGAEGKYEVLVDGLTAFWQIFAGPNTFSIPLEAGSHRVTIVLPSHFPGVIRSVELDDGASVDPVTYPCRIIFYGDSITQGSHSEKDSQSYAWLVTRYYNAESMILGVGGANFYPTTVLDNGFDPDIVIAALGTNDYCGEFTADEIHNACRAYLDKLCNLYPNKKKFYITPIWRADGKDVYAAGDLDAVRQFVAKEAEERNFTIIDGYTLVPHRTEYFADGFLHPNDMGFALYAQNLIKALEQHL